MGHHTGLLVMLVGEPGSGKSFLARRIAARLGAELLQTDAVRAELFAVRRYTPRENAAVYAAAHRRIARALLDRRALVFDATNLAERKRRIVYRLAEEARAHLVIVRALAPPEVIRRRLERRAAQRDPLDRSEADWSVYLRMGRPDPIPRPHLLVNTTVDLEPAIELVVARARQPAPRPSAVRAGAAASRRLRAPRPLPDRAAEPAPHAARDCSASSPEDY